MSHLVPISPNWRPKSISEICQFVNSDLVLAFVTCSSWSLRSLMASLCLFLRLDSVCSNWMLMISMSLRSLCNSASRFLLISICQHTNNVTIEYTLKQNNCHTIESRNINDSQIYELNLQTSDCSDIVHTHALYMVTRINTMLCLNNNKLITN